MSPLELYLLAVPFVFGCLIGSFLNVVIVRWPEERSIVTPRSSCPKCGNFIAWYDNIPLISWTVLRGKCRHCDNPISIRYPLVELLTGVLSVLTFQRFIPTPLQLSEVGVVSWVVYFALVAGLVAITFIDFEHYLIPDEISLGGIPVGIVGVGILQWMGGGIIDIQSSLLGVLFGAGSLMLVRTAYYLVRKQEGMGLGDVKMMGLLGAFLGAHPALLFILFVSSFLGAVIGILVMVLRRQDLKYALPFGPFLAIAAVIYLLWGWQYASLLAPLQEFSAPPGI